MGTLLYFKNGNYRLSLNDCKFALNLKPDYPKALSRAATCSFHIKNYDRCVEFCDKFLDRSPTDKEILKLRTNAVVEKVRNINRYVYKFRL